MKTQKLTYLLIAVLIGLSQILFTSCSGNKVVSSSFIQKRKYTKGFNVGFASHKSKKVLTEVKDASQDEIEASVISDETVVADNNVDDETEISSVNIESYKVTPKYFVQRPVIKEKNEEKPVVVIASICDNKYYAGSYFESGENAAKNMGRKTKRKTNGYAIASFVCGFLGILPFFWGLGSLLGIIFGIIALNQINKSSEEEGRGLAFAGIAIGLVMLFLLVLLIVIIFSSGFGWAC